MIRIIFLLLLLPACNLFKPQQTVNQKALDTNNPACSDPFYTVEIDGVTYSGSTKTAQAAYLESERHLKRVLYDDTLEEEERWKRVANIQESMESYNKFRCLCPENCRSQRVE